MRLLALYELRSRQVHISVGNVGIDRTHADLCVDLDD
jgi:hypothetical protein